MRPTKLQNVVELRELVRAAGLRCTASRLAVLKRLQAASSPMTHAEIAESLAGQGFDKATVFRNLIDLTDADLLTRAELGDHVWRFEIRDPDDPAEGKHPHFVCIDCGSVTCLSDVTFDAATNRRARQVGRVTEILLKGHCKTCQ